MSSSTLDSNRKPTQIPAHPEKLHRKGRGRTQNRQSAKLFLQSSKLGGAPDCFGSSLGSNPDIYQNATWATLATEWPTHSSLPKK